MRAVAGDRLVIKGHHFGEPDRDAEVLEVHGTDGEPPWLVRWSDDGHEGPFFPGSDAVVQSLHHHSRPLLVRPGRRTLSRGLPRRATLWATLETRNR